MPLVLRVTVAAGIAILSMALGVIAAVLAVRYVFPGPPLLPGGMREGTPIQILAFFGAFGCVTFTSCALGWTARGAYARARRTRNSRGA